MQLQNIDRNSNSVNTVLHIVQNAVNSMTGVIPIIVHP
jgi:hypothetical protein